MLGTWCLQRAGCARVRLSAEVMLPARELDPHGAGTCLILADCKGDSGGCEVAACGPWGAGDDGIAIEKALNYSRCCCWRGKSGRGNEVRFSKTHRGPSIRLGRVNGVWGVYAEVVDFIFSYYT